MSSVEGALVWLRDQPWPTQETSSHEKRESIVVHLLYGRHLVERGHVTDGATDLETLVRRALEIPAAHPKPAMGGDGDGD